METFHEDRRSSKTLFHRRGQQPNASSAAAVHQNPRSTPNPAGWIEIEPFHDIASSEWHTSADDEHPFLDVIRNAIEKHRLQSAAHYDLTIDVHQAKQEGNPRQRKEISPRFKIFVGFHNFGRAPILRMCGPESRKSSRKGLRITTDNILVYGDRKPVSLEDFLELEFPLYGVPVGSDVMFGWWRDNDKEFNWAALPTELKEHIIRHCLHDTPLLATTLIGLSPNQSTRKSKRVSRVQRRGPHEITDKFDNTSSLLRVSHQVRAIALRICLKGSIGDSWCEGLCISVASCASLKDCIRRLGKFHQMLHADGVPVDDKTKALATLYKQYPRIYPHLDQYATFAHGIRKIHLCMDYRSYLRFFKVTAGGFEKYWSHYNTGYEMFEQLPQLSEIVIELPDLRGRMSDPLPRMMPPLFYRGFECPRILHRLIYEQAAKVLALYPNVKAHGFIDELEEQHFYKLRSVAIKELKFAPAELADLYKDDGGGIELDEVVYLGLPSLDPEEELVESQPNATNLDGFWPPKCRCAVLCMDVLFPQ
ncbi:hypothetical protein T440DRAFT_494558 [Plenodomus tracheiphilus IPT5]|uniref:F-box domain-containing protein n=1 Tax=Plenodomus tracheiphilus IPT5 TaxID=1408161 RepID=A0A6A7BQ87_9PLEO|nr:hypothetical protein T440DRAFT_494558 [Plenodomus tracheiphilus IPT5]